MSTKVQGVPLEYGAAVSRQWPKDTIRAIILKFLIRPLGGLNAEKIHIIDAVSESQMMSYNCQSIYS